MDETVQVLLEHVTSTLLVGCSDLQASITFFRACERNSKCACKNTSYLDFVT